MHVRSICLRGAILFALAGCGGGGDGGGSPTEPGTLQTPNPSGPASGSTVEAGASSNTFTPQEVKIAVGKAVTWTFGARSHNVVFASQNGAPANIPSMANGQAERTFNAAGTFNYECTIHSGMSGTVKVESSNRDY